MSGPIPYQFPFAKYPALRIALLFIGGILLGRLTSIGYHFWMGAFAINLAFLFFFEFWHRRVMKASRYYSVLGLYLFGVIAFGAFWQTTFDQRQQPPSARLLSAYTWEPVEINGTVQNINKTGSGKYQLDVAADTTIIQDSLRWFEPHQIRAVLDPAQYSLPESLQLGSRIHFAATIYPLEEQSNPHEFNYKEYLATQNIYTQVGLDTLYSVQPNSNPLGWNRFRQRTLTLISQNFDEATIPLAKALLIGHKNELKHNQKIAFSRVGLSHIMAVSGLHVGFILAPFWVLIPFIWSYKWGKRLGLVGLIILLVSYAGLTGFSASVVRASITGGLITYGRLFHKARDSKNLTAVAAIIILLINPNDLFSIGFQLSFAAVYVILLVIPVVQHIIPNRIRHRWYEGLIMIVVVSVVVQLGLYPLLSYYFGEFSLAGPLANAVIIPGLTFIVPFALFLLPVSAFFPTVGYLLNAPSRWFFEFLQWFVEQASSWGWSWIQTPTTGTFIFLIWGAAILLVASLPIAKLRWKMGVVFLLVLCMQQGVHLYQQFQSPTLKVTMLDVGQGDAAFIQTPGGKHFLIDAGRWTPDYNSAQYVIIPHLKALGVEKLDGVFLSHPHADHIGGITELLDTIPIDTIYNSGFPYDSELYKTYIQKAADKNVPVKSLEAGTQLSLDNTMRFFVYGPSPANSYSDPNEHSLVIELIYGQTEFLFTGDGGHPQEALLTKNYGSLIDTDFLKVGHHGSKTASSRPFLDIATPQIAAVSLGKNNRFNHPHAKAVEHLQRYSQQVQYTSTAGALQFISDGETIQQINWR